MTQGNSSNAAGGIQNRREFATTQWTIVRAAGGSDVESARSALQELCQVYWYPLYSFVRFQGEDADSAADFTQAFFADLLQRDDLKKVDPGLGRFRSFLLAALKNFLKNQWNKQRAQKRGGGRVPFSLDFQVADQKFGDLAEESGTPDQIFERQWALTLIERVHNSLRQQFAKKGKAHLFDHLKIFLGGKSQESTIAQVAEKLGMSEVATKVTIHRMRTQFGSELRAQIQSTVATEEEVEEEIQHLFDALKG